MILIIYTGDESDADIITTSTANIKLCESWEFLCNLMNLYITHPLSTISLSAC